MRTWHYNLGYRNEPKKIHGDSVAGGPELRITNHVIILRRKRNVVVVNIIELQQVLKFV
jgi:hypothetical protein